MDISGAPSQVSPRSLKKPKHIQDWWGRGVGWHTKQYTHLHSYTISYRPTSQTQQQIHKLHT